MINLIPNEEKKKMSKDFYFRFATVSFVMLGVSVLTMAAVTLPSYFVSSLDNALAGKKLENQKGAPLPLYHEKVLADARGLNRELDLVKNVRESRYVFSKRIINEIVLEKIPGIKITTISYRRDANLGEGIDVSGTASNRETLLKFRQALEDNAAFSKVDLPISNFVKGSNIVFYLHLAPS